MRGRQPRRLTIHPEDISSLQKIAGSKMRPAFQVQRANIILAVAQGQAIATVAERFQCDASTTWRVCRRFERHGLQSITTLHTPKEAQSPEPASTSLAEA
jgi:hypothetical protein